MMQIVESMISLQASFTDLKIAIFLACKAKSFRALQKFQSLFANETEINDLEAKLDELLDVEPKDNKRCCLIAQHAMMLRYRSNQTGMEEIHNSPQLWSSTSSSNIDNNHPVQSAGTHRTEMYALFAMKGHDCVTNAVLFQHRVAKCRKCKERYVSDVCCSTKCGLKLV
jgi:hypothetical protein